MATAKDDLIIQQARKEERKLLKRLGELRRAKQSASKTGKQAPERFLATEKAIEDARQRTKDSNSKNQFTHK